MKIRYSLNEIITINDNELIIDHTKINYYNKLILNKDITKNEHELIIANLNLYYKKTLKTYFHNKETQEAIIKIKLG